MTRTAWSPGQRVLTAGLLLMVTAFGFEGLAVPTILPAALDEFGGLPLYGWAFSGFWLANLVGIAVAGSLADRRGPLPPFAAGVLLFSAGNGSLIRGWFAPTHETHSCASRMLFVSPPLADSTWPSRPPVS